MALDITYDQTFDLLPAKFEQNVAVMLRRMVEDVHRESIPLTPYKDNGLRSSVMKWYDGNRRAGIKWYVPYAAAQEQGGRTDPRTGKYIEFHNYTTPGTGKEFAKRAKDKVMANLDKYVGELLR